MKSQNNSIGIYLYLLSLNSRKWADVNTKDDQSTPLILTLREGHLEFVGYLEGLK